MMELVTQTPTELYFHRSPHKLQLLTGCLFVAGLVVIFLFGWRTDVSCERWFSGLEKTGDLQIKGWCSISKANLWMWSTKQVPFENIKVALLDGKGLTYRVILLVQVPLEPGFINRRFGRPTSVLYSMLHDEDLNDDELVIGNDFPSTTIEEVPVLHYYSYGGYSKKLEFVKQLNALLVSVINDNYQLL